MSVSFPLCALLLSCVRNPNVCSCVWWVCQVWPGPSPSPLRPTPTRWWLFGIGLLTSCWDPLSTPHRSTCGTSLTTTLLLDRSIFDIFYISDALNNFEVLKSHIVDNMNKYSDCVCLQGRWLYILWDGCRSAAVPRLHRGGRAPPHLQVTGWATSARSRHHGNTNVPPHVIHKLCVGLLWLFDFRSAQWGEMAGNLLHWRVQILQLPQIQTTAVNQPRSQVLCVCVCVFLWVHLWLFFMHPYL